MARDFKTLLKISTEISSLRGQESLQRYFSNSSSIRFPQTAARFCFSRQSPATLLQRSGGRDDPAPAAKSWSRAASSMRSSRIARAVLSNSLRSVLVAPLLTFDKLIGVIYLEGAGRSFDKGHLELLVGIAGMASSRPWTTPGDWNGLKARTADCAPISISSTTWSGKVRAYARSISS